MKKIVWILVAGIMMLGACKEKKKTEEIIATKYVPKKPGSPIKMVSSVVADTIGWGGTDYEVVVSRMPVDSLPMAQNEIGQKYIDNRISLVICRLVDGHVVFGRSFTRASFASYLTGEYKTNSLLADMRLREVRPSEIDFSVVVAPPDATDDEFLPLKLTVTRDGRLFVKVEDDLEMLVDTSGAEDDDGV